ncbi:MAG: 16S rRNA (uracil(1498)-N(3))-methyltransferase [Bacteroidales bacterium]|nr:16S rRNA (uracil(1498)-N(3))-methyltransferase [Bacteroidales bacterium]
MELYTAPNLADATVELSADESFHCIKVMRNRAGDPIAVTDGQGTRCQGRILEADSRCTKVLIESREHFAWEQPFRLHIAAAPTKNIDRFEWFLEKATELGMDEVTPLLCEHSERKVIKDEREEKILLAAARQSLRTWFPKWHSLTPISEFIQQSASSSALKLIAYCGNEYEKQPIRNALQNYGSGPVIVLIGPEGDFSQAEVQQAIAAGFVPVTFGTMRMRAETAAVFAAAAAALL